ncbi:MAG: C_GCAxxG_C_C family protein [Chloroflexi bacterium]|nr:MAG: C_GCAxxG_C_C family protein [Chloroflexota bacterium]
MIEKTAHRSRELFSSGYACAESVLLAIAEAQGVQSEFLPKIATGFCSGLARTCGTCGAVSGAVMGINLVTGRSKAGESVDENYRLVRQFLETFQEMFGSINCGELLGCDLGTQEGQQMFREKHLLDQCYRYAEEAARIAETIIESRGEVES